MTTKKEIFKFFCERGIYLPSYQLDQVFNDVIERIRKKESIFSIMYLYENDRSFNKYVDKSKAAFSVELERELTKKGVVSIDESGNEIVYDSLYAAAIAIGKNKDACGNISKCCKGKYKSVYGLKWRFHEKV